KDGDAKQVEMLPPPVFANFTQLIEAVPVKIDVEAIDGVIGYETKIIPVGCDEQDVVSSICKDGDVLLCNYLLDSLYKLIVIVFVVYLIQSKDKVKKNSI